MNYKYNLKCIDSLVEATRWKLEENRKPVNYAKHKVVYVKYAVDYVNTLFTG